MTARAGGEAAFGVALGVERRHSLRRRGAHRAGHHIRIISGDRLFAIFIEGARDRLHLGMAAAPPSIIVELAEEVASAEAGEPRRARAIAHAVKAVTGKAGTARAVIAAAQRNQLARGGKRIGRARLRHIASRADQDRRQRTGLQHSLAIAGDRHETWNLRAAKLVPDRKRPLATSGHAPSGGEVTTAHLILPLLMIVAACDAPPDERHHMPGADPAKGRAVMERVGCGSCHKIPGVWPQGRVGPPLDDFADSIMIAGRLPNRPETLTRWVRDAPALVPGTTMPAMPIKEEEARDVAAYLYTLDGR